MSRVAKPDVCQPTGTAELAMLDELEDQIKAELAKLSAAGGELDEVA